MRFAISSILTLATAAVVAQTAADKPSLDPPVGVTHPRPRLTFAALAIEPLTNAKRFAAGLPPLPPRLRHRRVPNGGSEVDTAGRTAASPSLPVNVRCLLAAEDTSGGQGTGWVTKAYADGYSVVSGTNLRNRVEVSFVYTPTDTDTLSNNDMGIDTGDYPFFGPILSSSSTDNNINADNNNYAVFGTTEKTGRAATVVPNSVNNAQGLQQASQSPVWSFNPTTWEFTPKWFNADGSPSPAILVRVDSIIYMTGNMERLIATLNLDIEANINTVKFICDRQK